VFAARESAVAGGLMSLWPELPTSSAAAIYVNKI